MTNNPMMMLAIDVGTPLLRCIAIDPTCKAAIPSELRIIQNGWFFPRRETTIAKYP
jgi:sugar (pentulose or hexulose) kinase